MKSRKHPRYRVEYCGSFSGEGVRAPGVILDLSPSGCRARSDSPSGIGESLGVLIDVPRYQTPLHVTRAVVRWSKGQEFGMEFLHIELDDEQRLNQLMRQMAADNALRTLEGCQAKAR
jgi:PilZ domain-containing protein